MLEIGRTTICSLQNKLLQSSSKMQRIANFLLLFAAILISSKCAEIGLAHRDVKLSVTNENEHLELFQDGFLLDDEETMEGISSNSSVNDNLGETSQPDAPEDIVPMADPEADSDLLIKFEDFAIPKKRLKHKISRHGRSKRLVLDGYDLEWDNGSIPYEIRTQHYSEQEVNLIHRGMAVWENHTCIRFVEHTNEYSYLIILPGAGCYSFVGKYIGPQKLSLAPACFFKPETVIHELGHAIGLFHEHSRPDRDSYIQVNYQNIESGTDLKQFSILDYLGLNTQDLPYDYNSIMHYSGDASAKDPSFPTIQALDPNIIVGRAVELSRLDILRVNKYYKCKAPFPPKTTIWTPLDPPESNIPPRPHECGGLIMGQFSGAVSTPGFPQYSSNLCCSWQIIVPHGYRIRMNITSFGLRNDYSANCGDGNITFLQLDSTKRAFSRICKYDKYRDRPYYTRHNDAHIQYCSGKASSNDPRSSFSMTFTAVDINECEEDKQCSHKCVNTPGGYTCACNSGYYLSADEHTCFDINECAIDGSLCEYKCRNYGGHYKCICPDGSYQTGSTCAQSDQFDGLSLEISTDPPTTVHTSAKPSTTTQPTTKPPTTKPPTKPPITNPPTTKPPTTKPPTTKPPTTKLPTTSLPTTKPTTTPPPSTESPSVTTITSVTVMNTLLTALEGEFSSPNWPQTYPTNLDLQWVISCPSEYVVEIDLRNAPFGIAGQMPACTKDWVQIHDGNSQGDVLGRFCYYNIPPVVATTSNTATVKFHAGPQHSSTRKGFSASYKCIHQCPSIQLPSLPRCGTHVKANSGTISSPNWPNTYNTNEYCEWIIELPDCQKVVEIEFNGFSVAGKMPSCPKDQLYVDDGLGEGSDTYGPYCHLSLPSVITTTSNVARFRFNAGPKHGFSRMGFSASFRAVDK